MAIEKIHRKKQPWLYEKYLNENVCLVASEEQNNATAQKVEAGQFLCVLLTTVKYLIPLAIFVMGILLML